MGVTKERTLSGSEKSGICNSGPSMAISTLLTEAETIEAILLTPTIGHQYSLTHTYIFLQENGVEMCRIGAIVRISKENTVN